jgi:hypothetical protein
MADLSPTHFLFIAGAFKERSSRQSAEVQLGQGIWGLRSAIIRDNLRRYLSPDARGLVYILKEGIRVEFAIVSEVLSFQDLDEFVRDEVRTEARYGCVKVRPTRQWASSAEESLGLLERVLKIPDKAELTRRLNLGMHGLTQDQYSRIVQALGEGVQGRGA